MKSGLLVATTLILAAACGGKPNTSSTPTNAGVVPSVAKSKDCPDGHVRFEGECAKTCQTYADCPDDAPNCVEIHAEGEREMGDDGRIGPVMEALSVCGYDH